MTYTLTVQKRVDNKPDIVREQGNVPGVVYGPDREPQPIVVSLSVLEKLYQEAGESSLIDLTIEGESGEASKVLIQDVQYNPVKGGVIHFDLREIKMGEEMTATIELAFVGMPPAVKELGGTLMKIQNTLEIKCLPKDLVSEVEVDLGTLKTFDDVIHVENLTLPHGIVALEEPDIVIAKVTPPLSEEELKAMEEVSVEGIETIEVEKKGKKEEEGDGADTAKKA